MEVKLRSESEVRAGHARRLEDLLASVASTRFVALPASRLLVSLLTPDPPLTHGFKNSQSVDMNYGINQVSLRRAETWLSLGSIKKRLPLDARVVRPGGLRYSCGNCCSSRRIQPATFIDDHASSMPSRSASLCRESGSSCALRCESQGRGECCVPCGPRALGVPVSGMES